MAKIKKGDQVSWKWGKGQGEGKVSEVHTEKVTKKIKGSEITRKGSAKNPAVVIKQASGQQVMKLGSELDKE